MQDIKRIVLTGGPCAGKTTALVRIIEHFSSLGFKVFTLPEVPTMFTQAGMNYLTDNPRFFYEGEKATLEIQLALEDKFMRMAQQCDQPCIVVCDRGAMDISAYMQPEMWEKITRDVGTTTHHLRDERYDELIAEGQRKRDDGDTSGALDALSQALAVAKTNSQKYEAFALRAEALDGNDDERQKKAGNMMYSLAQGDREMAGAYHVIARAEEKLGEYMNAMRDYQKAGELYKSAGMDEMAWLDLAAASRVAEDGAKSHQSAARLWEEAWQMVDEGDMSEEKKNKAYYELCLDRASMAEHAKKWREQLKWHREAARYDPRHEEAADALEAALKRQRKI